MKWDRMSCKWKSMRAWCMPIAIETKSTQNSKMPNLLTYISIAIVNSINGRPCWQRAIRSIFLGRYDRQRRRGRGPFPSESFDFIGLMSASGCNWMCWPNFWMWWNALAEFYYMKKKWWMSRMRWAIHTMEVLGLSCGKYRSVETT